MRFAEARNQSKRLPPEDRGTDVEDEFQTAFYWAIEKAEQDEKFMGYLRGFQNPDGSLRTLTPNEMNSILGRLKGVLERRNMYGYPGIVEDLPPAEARDGA